MLADTHTQSDGHAHRHTPFTYIVLSYVMSVPKTAVRSVLSVFAGFMVVMHLYSHLCLTGLLEVAMPHSDMDKWTDRLHRDNNNAPIATPWR